LREAGLSLFALSMEPPGDMVALEKRLGGRVTFLSDGAGTLLDGLGVRDERGAPWYDRWFFGARPGDLALPATLLIGAGGRIDVFHRSRRIDDRPPVDALIGAMTMRM